MEFIVTWKQQVHVMLMDVDHVVPYTGLYCMVHYKHKY